MRNYWLFSKNLRLFFLKNFEKAFTYLIFCVIILGGKNFLIDRTNEI